MVIGILQSDIFCYVGFSSIAFLIATCHNCLALIIDHVRRYLCSISLYDVPSQCFSVIEWTINAMFTDKMPAKHGLCVHNLPITLHLFAKTNLIEVLTCLNIGSVRSIR